LLAFRAIHTLAPIATWTLSARAAITPFIALALTLHPLLPLMAVLAILALLPFLAIRVICAIVTRTPGTTR
jgi:hypothetical protein